MAYLKNLNITLMDDSKFKINTQFFAPRDLSLFVDCLDTITRLTLQKVERKEKLQKLRMIRKFPTLPRICSLSSLSSSTTEDEANEELLALENKKALKNADSPTSEYDETYFSATSSAESSPRNSGFYKQQKPCKKRSKLFLSAVTTSDSDNESGIFNIDSSQQDINKLGGGPATPRSKIVKKSRSICSKAGFKGLVKKRESIKVPSVQLISCRALDENETLAIYQQDQQKIPQQPENEKLSKFATLNLKKKSRRAFVIQNGALEEKFLDKALRYLTL